MSFAMVSLLQSDGIGQVHEGVDPFLAVARHRGASRRILAQGCGAIKAITISSSARNQAARCVF
jgi:hypothetical protein